MAGHRQLTDRGQQAKRREGQGRFARTRLADHAQCLPGHHVKARAFDGDKLAFVEPSANAGDGDGVDHAQVLGVKHWSRSARH